MDKPKPMTSQEWGEILDKLRKLRDGNELVPVEAWEGIHAQIDSFRIADQGLIEALEREKSET